jgi:hypothetical protein
MKLKIPQTPLIASAVVLACITSLSFRTQQEASQQQAHTPSDIQEKVRNYLAHPNDDGPLKTLFTAGDAAVRPLIDLLSDPSIETRGMSARALAYLGNPEGLEALRDAVQAERDQETKIAMSCFLAGALVDPNSPRDIQFLKTLLGNVRFDDPDADEIPAYCAALALGMIGGRDSLALLRKAAGPNPVDTDELGKAIHWIESSAASKPAGDDGMLSDEDLIRKTVVEGTFFAQAERTDTSVSEPIFNASRERALVSVEVYKGPKSARGYDLALAKKRGEWRVVGIWIAWLD